MKQFLHERRTTRSRLHRPSLTRSKASPDYFKLILTYTGAHPKDECKPAGAPTAKNLIDLAVAILQLGDLLFF
jgi:hypothetical protein